MSVPAGLTPRQAQVLTVVREHFAATGTSPSYDEIRFATGLRSRSRVGDRIAELVERGHLVRGRKGSKRTLALAHGAGAYRVVLGAATECQLLARASVMGVTPEAAIARLVDAFAGEGGA